MAISWLMMIISRNAMMMMSKGAPCLPKILKPAPWHWSESRRCVACVWEHLSIIHLYICDHKVNIIIVLITGYLILISIALSVYFAWSKRNGQNTPRPLTVPDTTLAQFLTIPNRTLPVTPRDAMCAYEDVTIHENIGWVRTWGQTAPCDVAEKTPGQWVGGRVGANLIIISSLLLLSSLWPSSHCIL